MTPKWVGEPDQHWIIKWLVTNWMTCHYQNQCRHIVNSTVKNELTSLKFNLDVQGFHSLKCIWKCANFWPFLASIRNTWSTVSLCCATWWCEGFWKLSMFYFQDVWCHVEERYFFKSKTYSTHWGPDKMAAISQTTLSNTFSWMKML